MTFLGSEKAASEVIGHVIVLGLTITGISLISLVGIPAIYDLQDMANVRNAEQAFTVMDSRASAVVLGNSPLQFLDVNLRGGTISVEPNETGRESYIQVNIANGSGNEYITVPMGTIKYTLGERIIAYEGGGVWSKYPSGGSVMLSPPEFHYNGVTLTLPVINVSGTGSIGGKGSATLKLVKGQKPVIRYPNSSNPQQTNPVNGSKGSVYVNITSEFYDAWADYAKSLGYTVVSEDGANSSVNIKLTVVPNTLGRNTSITDPVTFRGLGAANEPLGDFSFILSGVDNNFQWDIRAKSVSGKKRLIFDFKEDSGYLTTKVGYEDESLTGYTDRAETWKYEKLFLIQGKTVTVDLLNTSVDLTYVETGVGTVNSCQGVDQIQRNEFNDTGFSWIDRTVNKNSNNKQSLYNNTQHYFQLMAQEGDISFYKCSPSGNQEPNATSTMFINYTSTGALSYLHISDNMADVVIS